MIRKFTYYDFCGRQEKPAILIFRLLLRMHRTQVMPASVGLPLRMNGMQRTLMWSRAFGTSISRNLITRVLTIYHVKLTQSTAFAQKRFEFGRCRPHSVTFGYYQHRPLRLTFSLPQPKRSRDCYFLAAFRIILSKT